MKTFHTALHWWPTGSLPRTTTNADGIPCVDAGSVHLDRAFPHPFDAVLKSMDETLNAYVEGDGSFVFTGQYADGGVWKTNGTLYEADDQILNIEIWIEGTPTSKLDALLEVFGVKKEECVLQLLSEGFFQTFEQFYDYAQLPQ